MSRRKPDCALCGERLRGAQIRVQLQGLPGSPEVGWHADTDGVDRRKPALKRCAWDDRLFRQVMDGRDEDAPYSETEEAIRTIQTRGESRVTAGKRWHEYLRTIAEAAEKQVRIVKKWRATGMCEHCGGSHQHLLGCPAEIKSL